MVSERNKVSNAVQRQNDNVYTNIASNIKFPKNVIFIKKWGFALKTVLGEGGGKLSFAIFSSRTPKSR